VCATNNSMYSHFFLSIPSVIVYFMSSLYEKCRKWFMVRMQIPFPVIMWHIYFRFLLILLVTLYVNSHQWSKWLNNVVSVLAFGLAMIGYLYTSSSFFTFGFVSNIHALAMVGLAFISATLMALNLTPFCPLLLTSLKLALIWLCVYFVKMSLGQISTVHMLSYL
jgi:hypothetical protein